MQRDFDVDALAHALEENHVVQRGAALAHRFDEFRDPALVMEFLVLAGASVLEADFESGVEICHFAQVAGDYLVLEEDLFEDGRIGRERGFGAGTFGGATLLDLMLGCAAFVILVISLPFLRTSTSNCTLSALTTEAPTPCRPPDTLYAPAIELAARMQNRVHDFEGVALFGRMRPDRDSATVILDGDAIVAQNRRR